MVKRLVTDLAQKVLQLELEAYLGAGWNHRTKARSGYRNGHYRRWLAAPYGPVRLKVPRCRSGRFDASIIFNRYRRRIADVDGIFRCPSKSAAVDAAVAWARRWKALTPWAVQCFMDGLVESLTFYNLPSDWWTRTRTNNPLERLIETLRMRLRPMGCFHDDPAIERAVFGQLARWHKIKLTHNA